MLRKRSGNASGRRPRSPRISADTHAVTGGKAVDRYVDNSKVLSDVKETFFNSDPEYFQSRIKYFFKQFGISAGDLKNLSVSAALTKLIGLTDNGEEKGQLYDLLAMAERSGLGDKIVNAVKAKTTTSE